MNIFDAFKYHEIPYYRIQEGNRAYAANHHMLKSKIIKRSAKMQIYKTLIRPVVTYGSETWTLTKSDENLLRTFERKILRKIYGPIQEGDIWGIRNNKELNRSINGEDIVKFMSAHRWLGHVKGMEEGAMEIKMVEGRLFIGRRKGRPRLRWMDDVLADPQKQPPNIGAYKIPHLQSQFPPKPYTYITQPIRSTSIHTIDIPQN